MKYLNTLVSSSKTLALILGTLLIGYAIAGLIAWAGAQYYGDLNSFMQSFRSAGGLLFVLRLTGYAALIGYWYRWRSRLLAEAPPEADSRSALLRIELLMLASIAAIEIIAWQSSSSGGEL